MAIPSTSTPATQDAPPTAPPETLRRFRSLRLALPARLGPAVADGLVARWVLVALVLVPMLVTAVGLWSELRSLLPSLNDDAFHYLFVERINQALAGGRNPFDVWNPAIELGYPQSVDYQQLPHLFVVLLDRLLLEKIGLLPAFNLTRYALMVGFPLAVFWSMRRMGFSAVAAACAAAGSSLLSDGGKYGFAYDGYVWRGFGMYSQLWAMPLSFITLACLDSLVQRGKGYLAAIAACTALVLCHLMYAEMAVLNGAVVFLVGLRRENLGMRVYRLAVVAIIAAVITSFFWLPFLTNGPFINVSAYQPSWKYDSFGAATVLGWLSTGQLLDSNRLPVLTVLLGFGLVSALFTRSRPARLALVLFVIWLALYFGHDPWGVITDRLPAHDMLYYHRLIGGVHLAAIMLIGLGGELIWRLLGYRGWLAPRAQALAAGLILIVILLPAFQERLAFYQGNTAFMAASQFQIETDADAATVLTDLKALPPGRVYAGLWNNWGDSMREGDLHFSDLLTSEQIPAVSPPYSGVSLNADLLWSFDDNNPADYDLFNARYVVAPAGRTMPPFLRPLVRTSSYTLYEAPTSGYAEFVNITGRQGMDTKEGLFAANRAWVLGADPAAGRYVRWDYPSAAAPLGGAATPACPGGGSIAEQRVLPDQLQFSVACPQPAALVLKLSYDQHWRVTIDGHTQPTFMVSPSYIGVDVPPGSHSVEATYEPATSRMVLLLCGALLVLAAILLRRQLDFLDSRLCTWTPAIRANRVLARLQRRAVAWRVQRSVVAGVAASPSAVRLRPYLTGLRGEASRFVAWRHRDATLLATLVATAAALNMLWLSLDARPPHWDKAIHLTHSLALYNSFSIAGLPQWLVQHTPGIAGADYPPLTYWITDILYAVLHSQEVWVAVLSQTVFLAILVGATYGIGAQLWDRRTGLLAAVFVVTTPILVVAFKDYMLDAPLTAMAALALYLLIRTREFSQRRYAIVFGLACGAGLLTKWTFLLVLGLPSAYAAALALGAIIRQHDRRRIVNLGIAALFPLLMALPWYLNNLPALSSDAYEFNALAAQIRGDPPVASLESILWYGWNLVSNQLFLIPALLVIAGIVVLFRRKDALRTNRYPLLLIAGTYVAFSLLDQKDPRYTLSFLPALAVIATYWLGSLTSPWRTRLQIATLAYCAIAFYAISFGTILVPQELFISLPSSPLVSSIDSYTPDGDGIKVQGLRLWSQQSYPLGAPNSERWFQEELFQYAARPGSIRTLWFKGPNVDTIWFNQFAMTYFAERYHVTWVADARVADTAAIRTVTGERPTPPDGFDEAQEYTLPDGGALWLYGRR